MTRVTPKSKKSKPLPVQVWTLGLPEQVPIAIHWWWLAGECRGLGLALADKHEATYIVTDLLELRYLYQGHFDPLGTWRHVQYVSAPCSRCGALSPLTITPANHLERSYSYPVYGDPVAAALIDHVPGTSRPSAEELAEWTS